MGKAYSELLPLDQPVRLIRVYVRDPHEFGGSYDAEAIIVGAPPDGIVKGLLIRNGAYEQVRRLVIAAAAREGFLRLYRDRPPVGKRTHAVKQVILVKGES